MASNLTASYAKEDPGYNMMKFGPQTLTTADNLFNPVWTTGSGFPEMTYAPGEYLNHKDASYECYVDPRSNAADFVEWSSNTPSLLNSPITGAPSEASYNDFLSPTGLGTTPPAWSGDAAFDQRASFAATEESITSTGAADRAAMKQSPVLRKTKVSKRKGRSMSGKSQSRAEAKGKFSSASSSSSSSSGGPSTRFSNSGHGGNHNITLRTASRKPKLSAVPQDQADHSPDSTPSSPDGGGDNLTSEERRARQNHNVVEKQYRNRLNIQFERLLAILPANQADGDGTSRHSEFDERRMSKAEVLDMARRRIHALEQERKQLRAERETLMENVSLMQRTVQRQRLGLVGGTS